MQDTELYHHLLGLQEPWQVVNVELNLDDQVVYVYVDFEGSKAAFDCPKCGTYANLYDRRETRMWRHLDSCQFQTYLVASLPRVRCREHGVLTANVFWAEPNSRFTALFERFALEVLRATQVQARAAQILRLSADQIQYLMHKAVVRGLSRRDPAQAIVHAGLDEKSFQQGHQYATILSDLDQGRVVEVIQDRTQEAATTLLNTALTPAQKESVQSVSMDMWVAFQNAKQAVLPNAQIVHDRFHIAGYLNDAVDATRKDEHKRLSRQEDKTLAKTKYLWLRSEGSLRDKHQQALDQLTGLELETAKVWAFKECFRQFFDCQTEYGARVFFQNWYEAALALGNAPLNKVAYMLHRHLEGLLAYIRHRVTNAVAENRNGQIQRVKTNARGFRQFPNFRVAILFFLGKLDIYPQTFR
jgi:transposase